VRICLIRRFGYFVTSLVSNPSFMYDFEKSTFVATACVEQSRVTNEPSSSNVADSTDDQERKSRLMRDMAALRLQAEISQLEHSLKNEDFALPPYLVIDTSVLCSHLNTVQKLVQSQLFIVVIPLVGQFDR
jgi:hypothetical protein